MIHVSWRGDAGALFPDPKELLRAVLAVGRIAGPWLLWFCVVDNHLHLVLDLPARAVPKLLGRLRLAFAAIRAGLALDPPRIKVVDGARHLENLVEYVLRNPEHHQLEGHPALHAGNSVATLLDAQLLPGFDPGRWRAHLPRWRPSDLAREAGVPDDAVGEATMDRVRELGAPFAARAAAAMVLRPDLERDDPSSVRARRAVVDVCVHAGVSLADVEGALGLKGRARRRHAARTDRATASQMLLRRIRLEDVLRTQPSLPRRRERLAAADAALRARLAVPADPTALA